jgi:hypothetical protein
MPIPRGKNGVRSKTEIKTIRNAAGKSDIVTPTDQNEK